MLASGINEATATAPPDLARPIDRTDDSEPQSFSNALTGAKNAAYDASPGDSRPNDTTGAPKAATPPVSGDTEEKDTPSATDSESSPISLLQRGVAIHASKTAPTPAVVFSSELAKDKPASAGSAPAVPADPSATAAALVTSGMLAVPVPPPPVPIPASPQPVPATGTTAIAVAAADVPSAGFTQLIGAPDSKDAQRVRANGGDTDRTAPVASASDGIDAADGSLAAAASQPGPVDPSDAADAQDQPQQALQKAGATTDDAVLPAPLIQPASAQSGDSAATPQISAQAAPAHHASAT
ncbi:MAG: hypothetical protein WBQ63_16695, partial [Candidatus Acidiferrales bacterium]